MSYWSPTVYCTYSTLNNNEFMKHIDMHNGENTYVCPKCEFKTTNQYELIDHNMNDHGIESEDTTLEDLISLGGFQPQDKIHIECNTNVITSVCSGAK